MSNPPNIFPTPPSSDENPSPIPLIILLKIAPVNCSLIQEVGFSTLSRNDVNIDLISGNILSLIASITQGTLFCKAATGPNIAVCAAVPAFFAIAVFFVAATTFANTSPYKTSNPEFNLGANDNTDDFVKSPVNSLLIPAIFLDKLDINLFFCAPVVFL